MGTNRPKQSNKRIAGVPLKNLESLADAYRKAAPYLNIGYVWASSVILFTLLGWFLDKQWDTRPYLTIIGAFLGVVTGFYNFIKTVFSLEKKQEKKVEENQNESMHGE